MTPARFLLLIAASLPIAFAQGQSKDGPIPKAVPVCPCSTEFEGDATPFIAEGIAIDRDRLLVAAIHARKIVAIAGGKSSDFIASLPDGLSPFGLVIDRARNLLWVAATSLWQSKGATPEQRGRSALLAFDLSTGAQRIYLRTPTGVESSFGDLALAGDGTVYVTDSRGPLFRLKKNATALESFGTSGAFESPQGIAIRPDNRYAVVADYARGLQRVELASGLVTPIKVAPNFIAVGIDGIAQLDDGSFVATQNGVAPTRIVRFRLSPDWSQVPGFSVVARAAPEISDVSLIVADGDSAVLTGISQWASFDETSTAPVRPVARWKLIRLNLR